MTGISTCIIDEPLDISLDPHTAMLSVKGLAKFRSALGDHEMIQEWLLTPATGKALLAVLPQLQKLLEMQGEGPTRPERVQ